MGGKSMTDKQINLAIAEFVGWVGGEAPDYTNDFDSIQTATLDLSPGQESVMRELISVIMRPVNQVYKIPTIRQTAEAFVKAIGKWEESK
jgi:hypothetical protein